MIDAQAHFIVERDGVEITRLIPAEDAAPSLNMTSAAEIKIAFSGHFKPNSIANYITDRMCIQMQIDAKTYSLGKYIITDGAPSTLEDGKKIINISAYDLTYLVKNSTLEQKLFISAGTKYINAIETLLIDAGIIDYLIDQTELVIAADREDWEIGDNRLTAINDLLAEINYNSLWMDSNGVLRCSKKREATAAEIDHIYKNDEASILYPETDSQFDYFNKPNVFIAIVENNDLPEPLIAKSVNDSPVSITSTINQGRRVVKAEKVKNIADASALQEYVDLKKYQSMLAEQTTTFYTGPAPTHQVFDVVAITKGDANGIYAETDWELELVPPFKMKHSGKKVIVQ